MEEESMFKEFVGMVVKMPYKDGDVIKVARGVLSNTDETFVKIIGELGTIIINKKDIIKCALASDKEDKNVRN